MQPVPPKAPRTIYELDVAVARLLDLGSEERLERVAGISPEQLRADDMAACRRVGAAVAWLGIDGLLVPSVRDEGQANLVVYTENLVPPATVEVLGRHRL